MLRAELAAYVGVIMLWRALDGAVRVAGVRGTTHETCNFCNVRRGETAEIISGLNLLICTVKPTPLYTPVAMARPGAAI